jgi:small conductance mechanosensitive channel
LTKEYSFYVFQVGIAYRENVDEVIEVLKQIGAKLQEDPDFGPLIKEPLEVAGLDSFGDSAVVIKARIKTIPIKQWAVGREFNKRMKKKFDELGIEIPFPHRTIYMGQDKEGQAPPMNVAMMEKEST